jgi:tRNA pseudouridine38-40 synthase
MRNIRLTVAYDGTDFHGWQRQPGLPTIQACVETAIERVTGAPAHLWGSGRTDAGVHALSQVANFKTECPIPCENLVKALNNLVPPTVRIKEAREVPASFHARYNVRSKTYRYRILQAPICSPFLWRFVCHHPSPLDYGAMAGAARLVEGQHDFTSFAAASGEETGVRSQKSGARMTDHEEAATGRGPASGGKETEMVRTIYSSRLIRRPTTSMLLYEVRGNGFLHHMVRNIVGTLMEVGRGKLVPADVTRILAARDRAQAGPTAPAQGLCLVKVEY